MEQMEKNTPQDFLCLHEEAVAAVRKQMPDEDDLYDLAELYKVITTKLSEQVQTE